jgi:hypothetical protein
MRTRQAPAIVLQLVRYAMPASFLAEGRAVVEGVIVVKEGTPPVEADMSQSSLLSTPAVLAPPKR